MDRKEITSDTSPVALEDLLKLKRLEQPDAAFWNSFEHDFKKRTLKELVKKPSLKEAFAQWLTTSGSRWIPASAVAAAAFFFANDALITSQEVRSNQAVAHLEEPLSPVSVSAPVSENAPIASVEDQNAPADSEALWSDTEADLTVDFIVASTPMDSEMRHYTTDLSADTLSVGYPINANNLDTFYTSNMATLSPDAFRIGM